MDIVQLASSAFLLILVAGGAATVWAVLWQLQKIWRDARSKSRKAQKADAVEDRIRLDLIAQGFSEDEARDAARQVQSDPHDR